MLPIKHRTGALAGAGPNPKEIVHDMATQSKGITRDATPICALCGQKTGSSVQIWGGAEIFSSPMPNKPSRVLPAVVRWLDVYGKTIQGIVDEQCADAACPSLMFIAELDPEPTAVSS